MTVAVLLKERNREMCGVQSIVSIFLHVALNCRSGQLTASFFIAIQQLLASAFMYRFTLVIMLYGFAFSSCRRLVL